VTGDVWSYIGGLREDLGRAEERIRDLETTTGRLAGMLRVLAAGQEEIHRAGFASDTQLAVAEDLAGMLTALADAIGPAPAAAVTPAGATVLSSEDTMTVLGALSDAAEYRSNHPDDGDRALIARYRNLARAIGDDR
jgi:hypothetical protein